MCVLWIKPKTCNNPKNIVFFLINFMSFWVASNDDDKKNELKVYQILTNSTLTMIQIETKNEYIIHRQSSSAYANITFCLVSFYFFLFSHSLYTSFDGKFSLTLSNSGAFGYSSMRCFTIVCIVFIHICIFERRNCLFMYIRANNNTHETFWRQRKIER